jgi:RNA polymerase sigma factor (sigma-70 family)
MRDVAAGVGWLYSAIVRMYCDCNMDEDLDGWFAREILSHEDSLVRYLVRTWPHRDDVHDLRQDAYVRVYEAAVKARPLAPKSFLFTTARNLMVDRVRRGRVVSIEVRGDLEALNVLVDEISPEQQASAHQQLRRLAEAFDQLPPKCRQVVWLRRVEELSQREVASRLGITEGTVEKHVAKGVRQLADLLFGAKTHGQANDGVEDSEIESDHG